MRLTRLYQSLRTFQNSFNSQPQMRLTDLLLPGSREILTFNSQPQMRLTSLFRLPLHSLVSFNSQPQMRLTDQFRHWKSYPGSFNSQPQMRLTELLAGLKLLLWLFQFTASDEADLGWLLRLFQTNHLSIHSLR